MGTMLEYFKELAGEGLDGQPEPMPEKAHKRARIAILCKADFSETWFPESLLF